MKGDRRPQKAAGSGDFQPCPLPGIRKPSAHDRAANHVYGPRSKPAKEDKRKMARPVLYQITDVFKGRKGKGANDSGGFDLLRLRLKHKEIKQKRQELHHFLHHRGDLHGSGQGVRPIQRGEERVIYVASSRYDSIDFNYRLMSIFDIMRVTYYKKYHFI